MVTRPVSGSTSRSTRCVPKLGPAPWALIRPRPPIGPPVLPATLAKSATDMGFTFSASAPSGRTWPSENSTCSGLASQSLHARAQRSALMSVAASTMAIEPEKVERLPPVRKLKPSDPVSPMMGRTFPYGTPSSSAATAASDARRPPMSGVPAISDTVPSSFTVSDTQVSPPMLNQKPERSEEHTSELQSPVHLVCRLLLEKKKKTIQRLSHQKKKKKHKTKNQ